MDSAVERYGQLENSYLSVGEPATIHVYLAAADFQLRFASMCAAAGLRVLNPDQVQISRTPGFGTFVNYLKRALSLLRKSTQYEGGTLAFLIEEILGAVQSSNGRDPEFGTLEKLRNHIFHGGPAPSGEAGQNLALRAKATVEKISSLLRDFLSDASVSITPDESGLDRIDLGWASFRLSLWPFICSDETGSWCVFSNFSRVPPAYIRAGQRDVRVEGYGEQLIVELNNSMIPRSQDRTFPDFVGELRADLDGFRDRDHQPHHHELNGEINVMWVRALSTGSESRSDRFRLGEGDQRQWWSHETGRWVSYPEFLRYLSNWGVVAKSVRQNLQQLEEQLITSERTTLGWTKDSGFLIPPTVHVTGLQDPYEESLQSSDTTMSFAKLRQEVDDRLSSRGSRTRIYFMSGEAGIGKTRTLVATALDRARKVESENEDTPPQDRLPLFFYVRSTGQASNSLQTVINAEAAATRNLNVENIRALCRNGLIALFVDGFDELLGGVGYDNALGALREWIEAMGGRGVIVVSARSSYYLNQYRTSLVTYQQNQDLAIEHRVALMQRWNDQQVEQFLQHHDVDPGGRTALSKEDRDLLGLPFFARVYVESMFLEDAEASSLPDLIIDQYLKREATKLIMPGDQGHPLLKPNELRLAFETLARLMAEQGEREVALDELTFAVEVALGDTPLESRRGLASRLSVLCGLAVSGVATADKRFAFQHELFYDIFLANAILRALRQGDFDGVTEMLGRTQWRTATVARLVRRAAEDIELMLTSITKRVSELQAERQRPFSVNVGSLWQLLIRQTSAVSSSEIVDATFQQLDLTNVRVEDLRFQNCLFGSLLLPPAGNWKISLVDCQIDSLWAKKEGASLAGVTSFDGSSAVCLVKHGSLVEKPQEVQRALAELGVPVPPVDEPVQANQLAEAATFFLHNVRNRVDSIFVLRRSHEPSDDNSKWQFEYGTELWVEFIRALKTSEAATLARIAASGPPVVHVRIRAVDKLLQHDESDESVKRFWDLVDRRG